MHHRSHLFIFLLLFLFLLLISTPAFAASITIESGDDDTLVNLALNGTCDLREAIEAANTDAAVGDCPTGDMGADTIDLDGFMVFAASTFNITDDVTIQNGTVDGSSSTQVFLVEDSAGAVTFAGMTIQNGSSAGAGGGLQVAAGNTVTIGGSSIVENAATNEGGGIFSDSPLFISDSFIDNNIAGGSGGGIYSTAAVTVTTSSVSGNSTPFSGGGIYGFTSVTVTTSDVSDNTASGFGGGISAFGNVIVEADSTFETNSAVAGGAIMSNSPIDISNSGFLGNEATAGNGGAVRALGTLTVSASVFIENNATGAGGAIESAGSHTITDTVFSGNFTTSGTGAGGAIYSSGGGNISGTVFDGNESGLNGGGLYVNGTTVTVTDTIFFFNNATEIGGAVYMNSGLASVTGSCIEGNSDTAVFNDVASTANFTGNWWGVSDGPSPTGNGDTVEGDVDVSGFLTTVPDDVAGFPCTDFGPLEPAMSLSKDDGRTTVTQGEETTYTLTFANILDKGSVANLVITDPLPSNITLVGCDIMPPLTGSCGESGGVVTLTINEELAAGESGSVTITVTVNSDATGTVENTAQLDYEDLCGCAGTTVFATDTNMVEEPAPAPVVEVYQDGFTPIPNIFGTANFAATQGTPLVSTFEVRNTGTTNLILSESVDLVGTGFTLVSDFGNSTIEPNTSTTFSVQCDAAANGNYTGSISFGTNDLNANPYSFALDCLVNGALILVLQDGITTINNDTGSATFVGNAGTPIVSTIEIRNPGAAPLTLTEPMNLTGTGFTLLSSFGSTTVAVDSSTSFSIQCDAAANGNYTGSISFATNVPDANPFTFALDCQVGVDIGILPISLPNGSVSTPYTQAITATGGSGSFTFAVTAGMLPPGLTLAANGTLSGTPTQIGNYSFTVTATDTMSGFYAFRNYTIAIDTPVPTLPPPPPTPVCEDHNFAEGGVVRASTRDGLDYGINCRVLYQNGEPTDWLGGDLYNSGSIGIDGIFDLGVQQAIDIFSPVGWTYFEGGAVFCLRGSGTLIWMAAQNTPRVPEIIGSYTVDDFPGFTCATLFEPGTLVLVRENPMG